MSLQRLPWNVHEPEGPYTIMTDNRDRVLVVDDDVELCQMLGEYLAADGFSVDVVHDGEAGVAAARQGGAGIVVLDITMPRLDGFETLRQIRAFSAVPVLMLTARGDDVDRIVGLELGADDYLPKPFNPRELSARLRAILRRAGSDDRSKDTEGKIAVGELALDAGLRMIRRNGEILPLTSTEYAIAELLMREAGRIVSKDLLSEQALGRRLTPFDRSLDTHVSNLRRKLGAGADGQPLIKTVRGRGYLFVSPS